MMTRPTDAEALALVGRRAPLWSHLVEYLEGAYDHEPVVTIEGRDRSWCFRYRRGGKTLVTLYPRSDAFTVLVVLGREEVGLAESMIDRQSARVRNAFTTARQFPDGRWLWIEPVFPRDLEAIAALLALKRRPKLGWRELMSASR
jgi:hypothetical protein